MIILADENVHPRETEDVLRRHGAVAETSLIDTRLCSASAVRVTLAGREAPGIAADKLWLIGRFPFAEDTWLPSAQEGR